MKMHHRKSSSQTTKKVRTAPTNTSLLPPCKVCQEPAAGFHYGANTCEACKGFFRRSLLRTEPYRCIGKGNCNIRAGKRKICPKCRHMKCLAVGMSKEAIKTGRYTHAKRTQDILEYRQMMGIYSNNSCQNATNSCGSVSIKKEHSVNHIPALQSSECDSTQGIVSPSSSFSACSAQNIDMLDSSSLLCDPFELSGPLSPFSGTCNTIDHLERPDEAMSQSSEDAYLDLTSLSQQSNKDASVQPSPDSSQSPERGIDMLADSECEDIVKHLVRAHGELICTHPEGVTPEKMLEKQIECFEACRLRTEMFGPLCLSDREYQDIYQKTGLDADNRQALLDKFIPGAERHIRCYVSFVKNIPGFSDLTLKDQVKLIRDNRSEFRIMCNYLGFNSDLKVVTFPLGNTMCIHDLAKIWGKEQFLQRFECAKVLQKLSLSRQEMIMLKCFMVLTAGKQDLEEPDKVSALQWKMAQCLLWTLKQTRKNVDPSFARIVSAVCQLRELCVKFYDWIKTNPIKHYQQIQENGLLLEWFSDS